MPTNLAAATPNRPIADTVADLDRLEFALTEDEIACANILQFDPDASVGHPAPAGPRSSRDPGFLAVPGYIYSHATWTRLAVGTFGGRRREALERFVLLRSRQRP